MAMNVKVVSTLDNEVNDIRMATAEIINEKILPHEADLWGVRRGNAVSYTHLTLPTKA